jgi:hypothetical protein
LAKSIITDMNKIVDELNSITPGTLLSREVLKGVRRRQKRNCGTAESLCEKVSRTLQTHRFLRRTGQHSVPLSRDHGEKHRRNLIYQNNPSRRSHSSQSRHPTRGADEGRRDSR